MRTLMRGDCLKMLQHIADATVDLVYADLPYGTTNCRWDQVIPFDAMWSEVRRIAKPGAAIVFHCAEPFTSTLIVSNLKSFRYRWTWNKVNRTTGHLDANRRPMRVIEDLAVFSYAAVKTYNPQMRKGSPYESSSEPCELYGSYKRLKNINPGVRFPTDILEIKSNLGESGLHPTQKPLGIARYIIETYTNAGDLICDFCMGSGTAGVVADELGRDFIGIEKDREIFRGACQRIEGRQKGLLE